MTDTKTPLTKEELEEAVKMLSSALKSGMIKEYKEESKDEDVCDLK